MSIQIQHFTLNLLPAVDSIFERDSDLQTFILFQLVLSAALKLVLECTMLNPYPQEKDLVSQSKKTTMVMFRHYIYDSNQIICCDL